MRIELSSTLPCHLKGGILTDKLPTEETQVTHMSRKETTKGKGAEGGSLPWHQVGAFDKVSPAGNG